MPALQLVVTPGQDGSELDLEWQSEAGPGEARAVGPRTQGLIYLASAVQGWGLRLVDLRLEDGSWSDSPDLGDLRQAMVRALRAGQAEEALRHVLDWPGDLVVQWIELRTSDGTLLRVTKDGQVLGLTADPAAVRIAASSLLADLRAHPDLLPFV